MEARLVASHGKGGDDGLLSKRLRHMVGGDDAVLLHPTQDVAETLSGALGVLVWSIVVGTLRQPGQQSSFSQTEFAGRLAEITLRGHLDAPRAAAQVDGIEIELQDLALAESTLDARRDDHLAHLAVVGNVVANEKILHQLLGDGRSALPLAAEVADEGPD